MLSRGASKYRHYGGLFQSSEIAIATRLISEFRRKWECLKREEFEDLLQECLTHWFFAKDGYDARKGASSKTFMAKVIRNKLTDLVREKEADRRKIVQFTISLDKSLENEEYSPTLLDKIDRNITADSIDDSILEILLRIDLSRILPSLSLEQKKLCSLLGEKGKTIKEISDILKTPRASVYDMKKRIRRIFKKKGLEVYLQ